MHPIYMPGAVYPQYGCLIATNLNAPSRISSKSPPALERSLVVAKIPLPSNALCVACIHLTSGRQTSALNAKAARVREISEFLTTYGTEVDLLAGDLNEDADGDVAKLLEANDFVDAARLFGMASVPASVIGTHRRDFIWIKSRLQRRLTHYNVLQNELMVNDIEGTISLSDHRPICITLNV